MKALLSKIAKIFTSATKEGEKTIIFEALKSEDLTYPKKAYATRSLFFSFFIVYTASDLYL